MTNGSAVNKRALLLRHALLGHMLTGTCSNEGSFPMFVTALGQKKAAVKVFPCRSPRLLHGAGQSHIDQRIVERLLG